MPPPAPDAEDDEDYASEEDHDFAPEADEAGSDSSDDSEPKSAAAGLAKAGPKRRGKRKRTEDEAEDVGFENSGDEAIITTGAKKRKRGRKDESVADEGDGLFVRTRAMRAADGG
jgi:hypothetical protein